MADNGELVLKELRQILEGKLEEEKKDYSELCKTLANIPESYPDLITTLCETVAFLAKTEEFRQHVASSSVLLDSLCPLLPSEEKGEKGEEMISRKIQLLRAIGNLCFEEDECREQCVKHGTHLVLNQLLNKCVSSLSSSKQEYIVKYKSVLCGCILNLCCGNEKLCGLMFELNIIKSLCSFLTSEDNESVIKMILHTLSVLVDAECCTNVMLIESSLSDTICQLIKKLSGDMLNQLMELIESTVSDEDNSSGWKVCLVKSGCVDAFLSLSEINEKVFNLIILIITSDDAMKLLFVNQDLWKLLVKYIHNDTLTPKLRGAAILVIANLARTDDNCQELVGRGLLSDLVKVIRTTPSTEETMPLLYAVMSVLRNLSLPAFSKNIFLKEGTVDDVVYVLDQSSEPNVLIKSIGCLRLLSTTNDVCKHLIETPSLINRIHAVSEMFSFPHIKIEVCRLCASLVKNCQDKDVLSKLLDDNHEVIYSLLCSLLQSEYNLLKNEGLIGLSITATYKTGDLLGVLLKEEESLVTILKDDSSELIENCLTLLHFFLQQLGDRFVDSIKASPNLLVQLKQLCDHSSDNIKKLSHNIIGDCFKEEH